jgi:DNA-binding MarR family transcriptional regulator
LPGEPAVELANRLNSVAIHLLRRLRREDQALGITGARLSALSVIVYGGPVTISALAEAEQVSAPTITRIVDALERDGLAARCMSSRDRRVVEVSATEKGRELMERGRGLRVRRLARELEALSAPEMDVLSRAVDVLGGLERPTP